MYGLSGASGIIKHNLPCKIAECKYFAGRHRCLWCQISSDALKFPRAQRGRIAPRTLQGIQDEASGGNLKNAKNFNNVIGPHFLDIELDQVCKNIALWCSPQTHNTGVSSWPAHYSGGVSQAIYTAGGRVCKVRPGNGSNSFCPAW